MDPGDSDDNVGGLGQQLGNRNQHMEMKSIKEKEDHAAAFKINQEMNGLPVVANNNSRAQQPDANIAVDLMDNLNGAASNLNNGGNNQVQAQQNQAESNE